MWRSVLLAAVVALVVVAIAMRTDAGKRLLGAAA
jgi:hypothetical protein